MFDIFGIRARRKAKKEAEEKARLEELAIKKKEYQERKAKIDAFLEDYEEKIRNEAREIYEEKKKLADKENSICPKCGSKNVVNRIVKTKGNIHGDYSSSFFLRNSYGNIDGVLDTLPVNKCNECGNEWEIVYPELHEYYNDFSVWESYMPVQLYHRINLYIDMSYDPQDIREKFNSLEEKREDYCREEREKFKSSFYRTLPKYMLDYALYQGINESNITRRQLEGNNFWGVYEDTDSYSYQMPPELWEICKKVIGWKGPEENE